MCRELQLLPQAEILLRICLLMSTTDHCGYKNIFVLLNFFLFFGLKETIDTVGFDHLILKGKDIFAHNISMLFFLDGEI